MSSRGTRQTSAGMQRVRSVVEWAVVVRYYVDPSTGQPHIYQHQVGEDEVEEVLARPLEDRPGSHESRVAIGQNAGRAVPAGDLRAGSGVELRVRHHGVRPRSEGTQGAAPASTDKVMKQTKFPSGWDEARVRRVLDAYEQQSDEEAVAEDEAAYESTTHTAMEVPVDLAPAVRELIAKRRVS